jgi:4-hydroxy-2-oxoheptanedioate aldolase
MDEILNLRKLLGGEEIALGIIASIPSAASTQALASAGFNWLMIDMEHAPIDSTAMHQMITATAGTSCLPIVRVPVGDSHLVKHALDAGAAGIVFPMICNREQAESAVASTIYPPSGRRGWGPFFAPARWGMNAAQYLEKADESLTRIVLIEHPEALAKLDEILGVPGIDCALLAPNDLSLNMGFPGQPDHPEVLAAIEAAEQKILASGISLGGVAASTAAAKEKVQRGYRLLVLGYEVKLLVDSARDLLGAIREH